MIDHILVVHSCAGISSARSAHKFCWLRRQCESECVVCAWNCDCLIFKVCVSSKVNAFVTEPSLHRLRSNINWIFQHAFRCFFPASDKVVPFHAEEFVCKDRILALDETLQTHLRTHLITRFTYGHGDCRLKFSCTDRWCCTCRQISNCDIQCCAVDLIIRQQNTIRKLRPPLRCEGDIWLLENICKNFARNSQSFCGSQARTRSFTHTATNHHTVITRFDERCSCCCGHSECEERHQERDSTMAARFRTRTT